MRNELREALVDTDTEIDTVCEQLDQQQQQQQHDGEDDDCEEYEKSLLNQYNKKVDKHILIYAIVLCVLNMCDRGSIGVAKVVGLEEDLGMKNNDFNIAATLFNVGYLSLVLFSNFVLKKVGASKLLPTLGILWGIVCTLQGLVQTKKQFFVLRLLLGMTECGFTTGILFILSFFYPKDSLTTRVGYFYASTPLSNVLSGPLASVLSQINHPTIKRWQWVFLVEGVATVTVSVFGYFILQDHPEKAKFLTDDEKKFIVKYKTREGTLGGSQSLSRKDVMDSVLDWQVWLMGFIILSACTACNSVSVFAPEILNELGFSPTTAQAMSALPSICGAIAILYSGWLVRFWGSHWLAGSISLAFVVLGSAVMMATPNVQLRVFALCLIAMGGFSGSGVFPGWIISANSKTASSSAISSGISVFFGTTSSIISANIFLNWDAPQFVVGHLVDGALALTGIAACIVVRVSMSYRNKELYKRIQDEGSTFTYVF